MAEKQGLWPSQWWVGRSTGASGTAWVWAVQAGALPCAPLSPPRSQMFQVIQPERALYIQANNCVEAKAWIDILTKVSQCNQKRLAVYHPSAYLNGHWLCCRASSDTAAGCSPCTG